MWYYARSIIALYYDIAGLIYVFCIIHCAILSIRKSFLFRSYVITPETHENNRSHVDNKEGDGTRRPLRTNIYNKRQRTIIVVSNCFMSNSRFREFMPSRRVLLSTTNVANNRRHRRPCQPTQCENTIIFTEWSLSLCMRQWKRNSVFLCGNKPKWERLVFFHEWEFIHYTTKENEENNEKWMHIHKFYIKYFHIVFSSTPFTNNDKCEYDIFISPYGSKYLVVWVCTFLSLIPHTIPIFHYSNKHSTFVVCKMRVEKEIVEISRVCTYIRDENSMHDMRKSHLHGIWNVRMKQFK